MTTVSGVARVIMCLQDPRAKMRTKIKRVGDNMRNNDANLRKMRSVELLPTWDREAGYTPGIENETNKQTKTKTKMFSQQSGGLALELLKQYEVCV